MPPAAVAAVTIGSALVGAYGQYKQGQDAKDAMNRASQMMSPGALKARMKKLNPQLYNAAYNGAKQFGGDIQKIQGASSFGDYLDRVTQMGKNVRSNRLAAMFHAPGYQDPTQMNYGLQMADQGINANMKQAGAQVGRLSQEGGMADAYAFANQAMKTQLRTNMWQQFKQQGEQLAREDVMNSQNLLNQGQSQAAGQAQVGASYASKAYNPNNWALGTSQVIGTSLGAYGAMKAAQGTKPVPDTKKPTYGQGPLNPGQQERTFWGPGGNQFNQGPIYQPPQGKGPNYGYGG